MPARSAPWPTRVLLTNDNGIDDTGLGAARTTVGAASEIREVKLVERARGVTWGQSRPVRRKRYRPGPTPPESAPERTPQPPGPVVSGGEPAASAAAESAAAVSGPTSRGGTTSLESSTSARARARTSCRRETGTI